VKTKYEEFGGAGAEGIVEKPRRRGGVFEVFGEGDEE
jgi:hypothetical protein